MVWKGNLWSDSAQILPPGKISPVFKKNGYLTCSPTSAGTGFYTHPSYLVIVLNHPHCQTSPFWPACGIYTHFLCHMALTSSLCVPYPFCGLQASSPVVCFLGYIFYHFHRWLCYSEFSRETEHREREREGKRERFTIRNWVVRLWRLKGAKICSQ